MTVSLINGCNSSSNMDSQNSDFYSNPMVNDMYRIPLIDPVELNSADEAYWFLMPVYNQFSESNESIDIDKVGIMDSIIVCFSERTYRNSEMGSAWYIIDVKNKSEKCIITHNDYLHFLQEKSLQQLELVDVVLVYNKFRSNKSLLKDKATNTQERKLGGLPEITDEIKEMLVSLNRSVSNGGDPDHRIEGLVSKGESNAKFAELKRRIKEVGYDLEWNEDKYILKEQKTK